MTIVVPVAFLPIAACLSLLLWAVIPRRRDNGWLNGLRPILRIVAAAFGSMAIWIAFLTWRLYA